MLASFLFGGILFAFIKYSSLHISNPIVTAMVAGIPTGLLSIYFIEDAKSLNYAYSYFFVVLSSLIATIIFQTLYTHTKFSKKISLFISLLLWIIINVIINILIK